MKKLTVGVLGIPFDYGIKLVGGRLGAKFAPFKVKKEFFELLVMKTKIKNLEIVDYGNVTPVGKNVKKTHEKLKNAVKQMIKQEVVLVVIGGSHDNSYGSCKAVAELYKNVGSINIDAHYDVRPVINGKINSGTPFRRLLDGKIIIGKNFVELGIHSPRNQPEHYKYLIQKKAKLLKLDYINDVGMEKAITKSLEVAGRNTNAVVFDIDIDGVQKRFAPGCSAPGVKGFTKSQVLQAAYIAGKNKKVKLFNLMEVSPPYDVKDKTVKLAAELILSFIRGLNERGK